MTHRLSRQGERGLRSCFFRRVERFPFPLPGANILRLVNGFFFRFPFYRGFGSLSAFFTSFTRFIGKWVSILRVFLVDDRGDRSGPVFFSRRSFPPYKFQVQVRICSTIAMRTSDVSLEAFLGARDKKFPVATFERWAPPNGQSSKPLPPLSGVFLSHHPATISVPNLVIPPFIQLRFSN